MFMLLRSSAEADARHARRRLYIRPCLICHALLFRLDAFASFASRRMPAYST